MSFIRVLFFSAVVTATLFAPYLLNGRLPLPTDIIVATQQNRNIWAGDVRVQNAYLTDVVTDFYPRAVFTWKQTRDQGHPNWFPSVACGQPNYFVAARSPLMILGSILPPLEAYIWGMMIAVFLSGCFMGLYLLDIGVSSDAAIVGSTLYMLCGHSIYFLSMFHYIEASAAIPLVFLAIRRISVASPTNFNLGSSVLLPAILLAFSFAWICLSRKDIAILTGVITGAYGIFLTWRIRHRSILKLLVMGLGVGASMGLVYFELGPEVEVLTSSPRTNTNPFSMVPNPGWVKSLAFASLGTVCADFSGIPADATGLFTYYYKPYFGIFALFLILAAVDRSRENVFHLLAIPVIYAAATGSPIHTICSSLFPPLGYFDAYRIFWCTMPCVSVLAALGWDRWHRNPSEIFILGSSKIRCALFAGSFLVLVAAFLTSGERLKPIFQEIAKTRFAADDPDDRSTFPEEVRVQSYAHKYSWLRVSIIRACSFSVLSVALFSWWLRHGSLKGRTHIAFGLSLFLITIDLIPFGWRYMSWGDRDELYPPTPALIRIQQDPGWFRVLPLGFTVTPNTADMYGIKTVNGFESLYLGHYRQLWGALGGTTGHGLDMHQFPESPIHLRILAMMGVKYVISETPISHDRLRLLNEGKTHLYQLPDPWGPVRMYAHWTEVKNEDDAIEMLLDPNHDSTLMGIVTESTEQYEFPDPELNNTSALLDWKVVSSSSDHLEIRTRGDRKSLVFVSVQNLPGWRVSVDGKPGTIVETNHSFIGTFLPSGQHHVVFHYGFDSIRHGRTLNLFLSALAVLILLGTFVWVQKCRIV